MNIFEIVISLIALILCVTVIVQLQMLNELQRRLEEHDRRIETNHRIYRESSYENVRKYDRLLNELGMVELPAIPARLVKKEPAT